MSKIVSIGTALPAYAYRQSEILQFMQTVFALPATEARKLRFMYAQSGIEHRHSVLADYGKPIRDWKFYPASENLEPFPALEQRMAVYNKQAPLLSVAAIRDCLQNRVATDAITHLITVSCTGMSAPGLDLQVMELLDLKKTVFRTSVNFMGCYAAIHALKLAHALCQADSHAKVLVVCTELCTLHFQKEATMDNMASSLLFGDGAAAALVVADDAPQSGLTLDGFYSEVVPKGKADMSWELSSSGFLMTLSGYVPELLQTDFSGIVQRALAATGTADAAAVTDWCIHPGGKKILQAIQQSLGLAAEALQPAYDVLREVGNLSSATLLFVLKKLLQQRTTVPKLFGAAFGPGLTVETFTAHTS